jgi:D-alanyl-D-alanine carboxypeptidase
MNEEISRRQFLGALPVSVLAVQAIAASPASIDGSPWGPVDRLCARLVTGQRLPGASLAVTRSGNLLFAGAWGHSNIEQEQRATPHTRFRIASVTKTYIGSLALRLAREGTLAIDEPAARWLPEFPRSDDFTLRMLLNHTAGLGEYTRRPLDELARDAGRVYSNDELVEYMASIRPLFVDEPGAAWNYSNTGYVLFGIAAERAAGASLGDLLEWHLSTPTGLRKTAWNGDHDASVERAAGYGYDGRGLLRRGRWVRAPFVSSSYVGASGALRSTAGEVGVWLDALFGGEVLTLEEMEELLSPATLTSGHSFLSRGGSSYGLGVWSGRTERGRVLWHSGSTAGFAADARHYPELGISIVMLGNADARRVGSQPQRIRAAVLDAVTAG